MPITKCSNLNELKKKMQEEGLLLMEGLDLSDVELLKLAASLSQNNGELEEKLLHWEFGPVMTMSYQRSAENYLFSDERVPFHWDGAFYREPSYLLFYCTESSGEGGETLFADTEKMWKSLTDEEQDLAGKMTLTYRTEKKAHYGGEINISLKERHPRKEVPVLRVAEEVKTKLNPVSLKISGGEKERSLFSKLCRLLYDPRFSHAHSWRKGDLVICDNFTFLHGRKALGENRSRTFKRIQIL